MLRNLLNIFNSFIRRSFPLRAFVNPEALPGALKDVLVNYELTNFTVLNEHLTVAISITWSGVKPNQTDVSGNDTLTDDTMGMSFISLTYFHMSINANFSLYLRPFAIIVQLFIVVT